MWIISLQLSFTNRKVAEQTAKAIDALKARAALDGETLSAYLSSALRGLAKGW